MVPSTEWLPKVRKVLPQPDPYFIIAIELDELLKKSIFLYDAPDAS